MISVYLLLDCEYANQILIGFNFALLFYTLEFRARGHSCTPKAGFR